MKNPARYLRRVFARFVASVLSPADPMPQTDISQTNSADLHSELLMRLIQSETDLAHLFLAEARSAYRSGNLQRGDIALAKAESIQSDADRHFEESTGGNKDPILASLQELRTTLESLQQVKQDSIQSRDRAEDGN
jgi:hypothetical protein